MPKKAKSKRSASVLERRRFILEQTKRQGHVSFDEIEQDGKKHGYGTGWQSIRGDGDFFEAMRLGVRLVKGKFILVGHNLKSTYEEREKEDEKEKKAIGKWTSTLIWGNRSSLGQGAGYPEPCRKMIIDQLDEQCNSDRMPNHARDAIEKLGDRIKQYWRKKHRYCALDAGTTNDATANCLKGKKAPDADAGIASLAIVTNAPRIEEILEDISTSTDVVAVGGQLRKDTLAHTGSLCEQCLIAWPIELDIAVVGTTSLNRRHASQDLCFACDSPDEARTKVLLLEKADIRCVAMSSSKCGRYRSSVFMFASLSNEFVDLLITDEGIQKWVVTDDEIHNRVITGSEKHRGEQLWDRLHKAGIGVLIAKS